MKVCCIQSVAQAWVAVDAGASAVGLVTAMPTGQERTVTDAHAEVIARAVPPGVDTFLLTSLRDLAAIVGQYERVRPSTLQLVDRIDHDVLRQLRREAPGVRLVQVVHLTGPEAADEARDVAPLVDAVLLDSGNPDRPDGALGGTGLRHDWAVSARIREQLDVPVFLAGGLTPGNVAEAVATIGPYGLDVCGGVRRNGRPDAGLVDRFMTEVRQTA